MLCSSSGQASLSDVTLLACSLAVPPQDARSCVAVSRSPIYLPALELRPPLAQVNPLFSDDILLTETRRFSAASGAVQGGELPGAEAGWAELPAGRWRGGTAELAAAGGPAPSRDPVQEAV